MQALYITLIPQGTALILLRYRGNQQRDESTQVLPLAAINDLLQQTDSGLIDLPVNLKRMGHRLFEWLQISDCWLNHAFDTCAESNIVLALSVDQCLAHLPWEALHDGTQFLNQRSAPIVAIVRWLDAPSKLKSPAQRSLQVLFMATSPENIQPVLDFEQEEANILSVTQDLPLTLRVEESGCLEELGKLWMRYPEGTFDVFHLTGRTSIQSQPPQTSYFITETLTGEQHDATATDLAAPFKLRRPRLVFLSGCRTGQSSQAVPSLAQALVQQGLPAVLGWGRSVADSIATTAAAYLYARLAQGCELPQSVALTQAHLRQQLEVSDWHRLRLYVRGQFWGALVDPLGDFQPLQTLVHAQFLDVENKVRVATPEEFVGRRRTIQRSLRVLRGNQYLGVIVHGLGGAGKSSTAARLLERLPDFDPLVIYQELDAANLERSLERQSTSEIGFSILQSNLPLMQRLTQFLSQGLNQPNQKFIFVLDDFEANLESQSDGRWGLKPEVVPVLTDLMEAISRSDQPHRILLTSRYNFSLPELDHRLHREPLPALCGADLQKKCERLDAFKLQSRVDLTLRQQALSLSDGNPRLLEWLDRILQDDQTDAAVILERMNQRATDFRESILVQELLQQQEDALRLMLARGSVFELPVPLPAMEALWSVISNWEQHRNRARALGLLEWIPSPEPPLCRVPRLLAPLLPKVEDETLAVTAVEALYQQWWRDNQNTTEKQTLELYRLAQLAKNLVVLDEVGTGLATYWREQGRYRDAGLLYEEIIKVRQQRWGSEHPDVATSLNNLAELYKDQGRYEEAETLHIQALEMNQRLLGQDHPHVATSLNNLASLYSFQGHYVLAEFLLIQALKLQQHLLGNHSDVTNSLNNLANLYHSRECYNLAESFYLQALEMDQQRLGQNHPDVANSLNNLAELYKDQERYEEAETLHIQALEMRQHLLGNDHPHVATSLNNLASLYDSQGRYEESESFYLQALEMNQRLLGNNHPHVASSLNNLALLYYSQGRYNQAEPLFIQALAIAMAAPTKKHPTTQIIWQNFVEFLEAVVADGEQGDLSNHPLVQDLLHKMQSQSD